MHGENVRVRYVGGTWDGLEMIIPGPLYGQEVQFPYNPRAAAQMAGEPIPEQAGPPQHMSIYRYDDAISDDGVLYCRFVRAYTREEWKEEYERQRRKRES